MIRILGGVLVLALAACTATAPVRSTSACSVDASSYECQVETYSKAGN